jgi:hypothetical protein
MPRLPLGQQDVLRRTKAALAALASAPIDEQPVHGRDEGSAST